MKTVFDTETHDELLERLGKLKPDSERQWGKMSPAQMMEHSARALEMAAGKEPRQQRLLGKAIGWIFRSGFLSEKPIPRNAPTGPTFVIQNDPDFEATRKRLTDLIAEFHGLGEVGTDGNIHGFFGPLSGKQWGETQYKHLDHHLRQFGL
jgi:hypothetical protein